MLVLSLLLRQQQNAGDQRCGEAGEVAEGGTEERQGGRQRQRQADQDVMIMLLTRTF